MLPKKVRNIPGVTAGCAALLLFLAACGSDSTGPATTLDAAAALQSLSLGAGGDVLSAVYGPSSLAGVPSQFGQVNVSIDGKSQNMYALAVRETYPAGTCVETLIVDPAAPNLPGDCTPLEFSTALILWQSHSANTPPDRLALILGGADMMDFADLTTGTGASPGFAIYVEGQDEVWVSVSGTLATAVTPTNQACAVPLPPYAKSGSCSFADFLEQGTINFEPITGVTMKSMVISQQTIHGIWQTITETQTITVMGA
jgi:hypothetical protein